MPLKSGSFKKLVSYALNKARKPKKNKKAFKPRSMSMLGGK